MLTISVPKTNSSYQSVLMLLAYTLIFIWFLPNFLYWDTNLYAGILLAPFICRVSTNQLSIRYLIPTCIAFILAICLPVKTTFFIALLFAALFFVESTLGKLSEASLFLLFLISPVFKYLVSLVDFPIRLWLTTKVSEVLSFMGIQATAVGNQIEMEKYSFGVDPACAGLNMLIISLIICLFLLVQYQLQYRRKLGFLWVPGLFLFTIGLNVMSNFFRILLLVLFKIMPETIAHDMVGIICLCVYVALPLIFGLRAIVKHFGVPNNVENSETKSPAKFPILHLLLVSGLTFLGPKIIKGDELVPVNNLIKLDGFKKTLLPSNISKFENKEILVYIKPAPFYIPGHDPKLCWTGSGYEFKNIREEVIADVQVYTALLTKGNDKIYAAWWFDNGTFRTVDQLAWRWKGAVGASPFYLINVNAMNRNNLNKQITTLIADHRYLTEKP